jgi:integrase
MAVIFVPKNQYKEDDTMRLPNGYGSVVKLPGKRRKPYAIRTSEILEYIDIDAPKDLPKSISYDMKRLGFKWKGKKLFWSAIASDKAREYAEKLMETDGFDYSISFRQTFKYIEYFAKKERAYSYLSELNNADVVPEHIRFTDTPTFAEMYDKWKKYRQTLPDKISSNTWRNYEIAFNHLSDLHHKKFNALRTDEVQECINKWTCKSNSTVSNIRTVLNNMYKYALMNNYIEKDLSQFFVYSWVEPSEQIHSRYTDEEIAILWANLYVVNNVDLILITIYSGLRPTELLEITTDNVHIDEQYMVGGMKTEAGTDRIIPIADKILPLVKNRYDPNRRFLVNNKYGNHYTYGSYVSANFNTVMNRLQMQHLPHDGRHTFASLMDDVGANEVCLKLIMGHSMKNDVTKGVYTHKSIEQLLAEVNKI